MLSEFLLWASAIGLGLCGYILTQRDIIALVGVSIPQVAMGLGALTLIVAIWGRLSDYRRWQCGFYIMAISLIFLFLAEVLVVGYQQIQYADKDGTVPWSDLDDEGQNVVMSNYKCCGWKADEHICQNSTYPYYMYRDDNCQDETKNDYSAWVFDVTIIFSAFAGFHLLYTCVPCLGQAKRLQMKAARQEEANKKQVRRVLDQRPRQSPRGSWFFRRSPRTRQKNVEQEIRTADVHAMDQLVVNRPGGRVEPQHGQHLGVKPQGQGKRQARAGSTSNWETTV